MTDQVGKDLKGLHDAIYGQTRPENIFGGGNAGIALAGRYIADAMIASTEAYIKASLESDKLSQSSKISELEAQLYYANSTIDKMRDIIVTLEARLGSPPPTQLTDLTP